MFNKGILGKARLSVQNAESLDALKLLGFGDDYINALVKGTRSSGDLLVDGLNKSGLTRQLVGAGLGVEDIGKVMTRQLGVDDFVGETAELVRKAEQFRDNAERVWNLNYFNRIANEATGELAAESFEAASRVRATTRTPEVSRSRRCTSRGF